MFRRLAVASLLLSLSACASVPKQAPPAVEFAVIGDMPYNPEDPQTLTDAVAEIRRTVYPFVLHVGDMQASKEACGSGPDQRLQALIHDDLRGIPVVYTPGDNEWTDCDRDNKGDGAVLLPELERLDTIRATFFSGARPNLPGYVRQAEQVENARFTHSGLVFVTVHVVGTNNGRNFVELGDVTAAALAANGRDNANRAWLDAAFRQAVQTRARGIVIVMQADIWSDEATAHIGIDCQGKADRKALSCDGSTAVREALEAGTSAYYGPVFILHGDTEPFTVTCAGRMMRLNAAGDGVSEVARVRIDPAGKPRLSVSGLTGKIKPTVASCP